MLAGQGRDTAAAEKEIQAAVSGDPKYAGRPFHLATCAMHRAAARGGQVVPRGRALAARRGQLSRHLGAALRKTGDIDGALTELRQATRWHRKMRWR